MRRLRLLILQFAAFTFGKQIMVTTRNVTVKKPRSNQDERDACITAILEACRDKEPQGVRAQLRVFRNLPAPEWDEFGGNALDFSFHSQEWMAFKKMADDLEDKP